MAMVIAIGITSCKKGDKGDTGPTGINGNANVHSQTFLVLSSQWTHNGTSGQQGDSYSNSQLCYWITDDIASKGAVLAYTSNDNLSWDQMPFTIPLYSGHAYSESYLFEYKLNQITFYIADSDFLTLQPSSAMYFKVVCIASSVRMANPNVNWKNYTEVKAALHLTE